MYVDGRLGANVWLWLSPRRAPTVKSMTTTRSLTDPATAAFAPFVEDAVRLADRWAAAAHAGETKREAQSTGQLAALLSDHAGLDMAVFFVDRVARPEDDRVAANALSRITASDSASFLGPVDRALLGLGARAARIAPKVVVPAARSRMKQMVGHLIVDALSLIHISEPTRPY